MNAQIILQIKATKLSFVEYLIYQVI